MTEEQLIQEKQDVRKSLPKEILALEQKEKKNKKQEKKAPKHAENVQLQLPPMMGFNPYSMMPMMGMQNQFMQQYPMHPQQ